MSKPSKIWYTQAYTGYMQSMFHYIQAYMGYMQSIFQYTVAYYKSKPSKIWYVKAFVGYKNYTNVASSKNPIKKKRTRPVHSQPFIHCRRSRMVSWKGARSETLVEDPWGLQTDAHIPSPSLTWAWTWFQQHRDLFWTQISPSSFRINIVLKQNKHKHL